MTPATTLRAFPTSQAPSGRCDGRLPPPAVPTNIRTGGAARGRGRCLDQSEELHRANKQTKSRRPEGRGGFVENDHRDEGISVLGRPGSDLLSQALRLSTIGAEEFNGRVRDGIGFRHLARATRPAKDGLCKPSVRFAKRTRSPRACPEDLTSQTRVFPNFHFFDGSPGQARR